MFVTKNRAGISAVLLLAVVVFVTACGPPGPRALLQGRKALEAGRTDAAVTELKIAVSLLPTNASAWNYLGLAYHHAGQSTNAIEAYSRAIKLDRDLLEARFNLGCVLLDADRLEAAKTELTAYTLRRGNEPEGWLKLGAAHLRAREGAGAEKCFREALRVETNNVEALNGLGLVQLQRNRAREAASSFSDALKVQPDYRPALLNLATVSQQQLNDRPEALRRYREYLTLQPRGPDWDAINALVRSLEPPVNAAQPERTLTNGVANNAVSKLVLPTNQSRAATQQGAATKLQPVSKPTSNAVVAKPTPTATNVISSSIATPPPLPEVLKSAAAQDMKPVAVEPKPSVANSNPASQHVSTGTVSSPAPKSERRGFFSKLNPFSGNSKAPANPNVSTGAVAASPPPGNSGSTTSTMTKTDNRREAEAALFQGQQAQRANRDAEAFQFFRRAAQLDPGYFEAHYSLGFAAFRMRSFPAAINAWESALALRPNNADARYNLALTLKAANHPQDAANQLEKLLSLHPDEARGHLTLGNLYADQLRDIPRARKHYSKVLQLDPRNPQGQAIRFWLVANPG